MKRRGGAGTAQPAGCSPPRCPRYPFCFNALTAGKGRATLNYFTCFSLQVTLSWRMMKSNSGEALRACSRFAAPNMLPGESTPCIYMCKFVRLLQLQRPPRSAEEARVTPQTPPRLLILTLSCREWRGVGSRHASRHADMRWEEFTLSLAEASVPCAGTGTL